MVGRRLGFDDELERGRRSSFGSNGGRRRRGGRLRRVSKGRRGWRSTSVSFGVRRVDMRERCESVVVVLNLPSSPRLRPIPDRHDRAPEGSSFDKLLASDDERVLSNGEGGGVSGRGRPVVPDVGWRDVPLILLLVAEFARLPFSSCSLGRRPGSWLSLVKLRKARLRAKWRPVDLIW